ncbi:MAG: UbiD family decarboxylase [Deltaproteobacteria bacterium]|nr:UbiD family decarboxylase [Deltaproteobacteria bacterium]
MTALEARKLAEEEIKAGKTPAYTDLREWLEIVDSLGELKKIDGVDWNLEMGTLAELVARESKGPDPAVLFDNVKDYPRGYRALFAQNASFRRMALNLGLPLDLSGLDLVRAFRDKLAAHKPIPHKVVKSGPILENVLSGKDINLLKFPVPFVHELDGGRYIGTGCLVITKDPEEGWVNFGTYRGMVHDETSMGLYISPGKHGRIQIQKYFDQGKRCPVIISVGQDPVLFMVSGNEVDYGVSEFDYAGGLKGAPVEVIEGKATGLPFPAHAEIVIEGFMEPGDIQKEGPFGEWTGYYASSIRPEPVVRVQNIYHRNDPILCCARPGRPPSDYSLAKCFVKAALIWDQVEKAGIPDVKGVWCHEAGGGRLLNIISIKQRYPGHARQALVAASQVHAGAYLGRYVIVVDEDIDPTNTFDILWAVATRSDPVESIDIIRRCWSGPLDPRIQPGKKGFNSRALIDACRPFEWIKDFPPVAESSPELREEVRAKWKKIIEG